MELFRWTLLTISIITLLTFIGMGCIPEQEIWQEPSITEYPYLIKAPYKGCLTYTDIYAKNYRIEGGFLVLSEGHLWIDKYNRHHYVEVTLLLGNEHYIKISNRKIEAGEENNNDR